MGYRWMTLSLRIMYKRGISDGVERGKGAPRYYTPLGASRVLYVYIFKEYRNPSPLDCAVEVPASTVDDGSGRSKFLHKHKIVLALLP